MHFLAQAHRTKLLGTWTAALNGRDGAQADAYVAELVTFSVANPGDQALFDRLRADLPASVGDHQIRERIAAAMAESVAHVKTA